MVQNGDNRTQLYQVLWLMILTPDPDQLHQYMQHLSTTWREKEPKFVEYFESAYANRAGIIEISIMEI